MSPASPFPAPRAASCSPATVDTPSQAVAFSLGCGFALVGDAWSGLQVGGLAGRLVRRLPGTVHGDDLAEAAWDGRDDRGRPVPAGVYLVRVAAPGTGGAARVMMLR